MDIQPVRHFLAALDGGSFVTAAARLNVTPQAVNKSILRLESQLGIRLFERDGRRLRPTAYAELLAPHARTIAAEADKFRAELGDMLGGHKGRLRIGVGPSAAADLVARAVLSITRVSGREIHVLAGVQAQLTEALILGQLDLFVAVKQVDRADPLIREEELGAVRYVVVAGSSHPLAGRGPVTLAAVAEYPWIAGANLGDVDGEIQASLEDAGVAPLRTTIETTSVLFTLSVLDAGQHLAILPDMLVGREVRSRRLAIIELETVSWTRPLIVATRARGPIPSHAAALVAALRASLWSDA